MKKIELMLTAFIAAGIFLSSAQASEIKVEAQVDKKAMTTDEALTYKISVSSLENKLPEIKLPDFAGFTVISQAQSSSFNFSSGKANNSAVFIYVLACLKVGKLEIKPASVKIGKDTFTTESFVIEVKQGKNPLRSRPEKQDNALPEEFTSDRPQYAL